MTTNDFSPNWPDLLGNGNQSFFGNQVQSNEGTELADYRRITNNFDPATINRFLQGQGFGLQRFNELYQKYGNGQEEPRESIQTTDKRDDIGEWDWDLYSESRNHRIEAIKAHEARQEAKRKKVQEVLPEEIKQDKKNSTFLNQESTNPTINYIKDNNKEQTTLSHIDNNVSNIPDALPEEKGSEKDEEKPSKKAKRIQKEKLSYSDYDNKMMEQGKKGFDYMYEKESEFLRLRDEVLNKLLTEKFNVGAIKAYLFIWKMAYKHKRNSLHWTASANEIAKEVKLSTNTVLSGLKQLEKRGLIKTEDARHERSSLTYIILPLV